jgi:SAM-dependent methyltransferase
VWEILDTPALWEATRVGLDLAFGLYRRRIALLRRWGVLDGDASLLDIGCGIGQYSTLASGEYLGIDLNRRYINYAQSRRGGPGRSFRCVDVRDLSAEGRSFDVVLMVDFLHHLDECACHSLLETARAMTRRALVSFEPIAEQRNPVGRWIVEHDRGDHMRPLVGLRALLETVSGLAVREEVELALGPIATQATLCAPAADR